MVIISFKVAPTSPFITCLGRPAAVCMLRRTTKQALPSPEEVRVRTNLLVWLRQTHLWAFTSIGHSHPHCKPISRGPHSLPAQRHSPPIALLCFYLGVTFSLHRSQPSIARAPHTLPIPANTSQTLHLHAPGDSRYHSLANFRPHTLFTHTLSRPPTSSCHHAVTRPPPPGDCTHLAPLGKCPVHHQSMRFSHVQAHHGLSCAK